MVAKWVLIITFTSFFNGETKVTVIDGFTSLAACEVAALRIRDGQKSCIEKR